MLNDREDEAEALESEAVVFEAALEAFACERETEAEDRL